MATLIPAFSSRVTYRDAAHAGAADAHEMHAPQSLRRGDADGVDI
jgi:hypothetical protein